MNIIVKLNNGRENKNEQAKIEFKSLSQAEKFCVNLTWKEAAEHIKNNGYKPRVEISVRAYLIEDIEGVKCDKSPLIIRRKLYPTNASTKYEYLHYSRCANLYEKIWEE